MTENEKQKSGFLKVFFIEFAVKPSEFDRGFLGRSELILPLKSPLTPSFVGSNPATPATDTIYCIRNVLPNTIYGFCFICGFFSLLIVGKIVG